MYQSNEINELMGALAKAQGKMSGAIKDAANPFFKSKYADLNSVWSACREPLSENGLAVTQTVQEKESGEIFLRTTLAHSSGQWISSIMPIRIKSDGKKNELQELGACLTYLRRYTLSAIVGVAPDEDDDGNSVSGYKASPQRAQVVPMQQAPQIQYVNDTQINEYNTLLDECDEGFRKRVTDYILKNNIKSIELMPLKVFETLRQQMQNHIAQQGDDEACVSSN